MNSAFGLCKTQTWSEFKATADQTCLLRPRQSQDSWAGAKQRCGHLEKEKDIFLFLKIGV